LETRLKWSFRLDGEAFAPSADAEDLLRRTASQAESVLGGPVVAFGRAVAFSDSATVRLGVARKHVVVSADGDGGSVDGAIAKAAERLAARIPQAPLLASLLSAQLSVGDVLIDSWRLPSRDRDLSSRLVDGLEQRFYYHLTDEEALARAQLDGRPFYVYGAAKSRELRVLVLLDGHWYAARDVERPLWRLATAVAPEVDIPLLASGHSGEARTVRFDRRHVFATTTLEEAVGEFRRHDLFAAQVQVGALNRNLLIVRDGPEWIWVLGYELDAYRVHPDTGPFGVPTWTRAQEELPSKFERLREVVRCPACRSELRGLEPTTRIRCASCRQECVVEGGVFRFLEERPAQVGSEVSRNTPSKQLIHDLRLHEHGMVLNAGAGDTPISAANLVNLEVVRYPFTDVVADAQHLPFADGVFDMVFSQSVVEHIPDPFKYVNELVRVLKPGGTLLLDAPFVAPYHGYPDHYFNPTKSGLRVLCRGLEEIEVREGSHHDPAIAVLAILGSFVRLVRDANAREDLLRTPIGEFLDQLQTGRQPALTRDLDPNGTFEISAGFRYYGRKGTA
jgi:hypothetical protein